MTFESGPIAQKLNDFVVSEEAWWWLVDFNELTPVEQALIGVWELEQEVITTDSCSTSTIRRARARDA
jgi:hypothetical protein